MNAIKVIGSMVLFAAGFALIATVLGSVLELEARYHDEHDRCLKQATNGYEMEKCR